MAVMNAGLIISPNIGGFLGLLESFNFLLYQFFFFFFPFFFLFSLGFIGALKYGGEVSL